MTAGNPRSPFPEQAGLHPEDPMLPSTEGLNEGDPTGPTGGWLEPSKPSPFLTRVAVPGSPHL